ncbi:MAG: hypothetical protein KDA80_12475 [Planctomycetaceae bacterium]|nr:hypothetical protein [Planctomycetaceae bacterium]
MRNTSMRNTASLACWLMTFLVGTESNGWAQDPHLAYAYPAGCQTDSILELTLGGQHLKDVTSAYISGQGVEIEVMDWYRPMTRGEYNAIRMRIQDAREELIEKGKTNPSVAEVELLARVTDEQKREMEIYLERERDIKRQPNEQLEEELTLRMIVAPDAEPGKRELRLVTETAMSNPIWFHIGTLPEVRESEPNDTDPCYVINQMPVIVNGQIMPGDVDRFSFDAEQGQGIVVEVAARDVIPYLADAVPGWFQASLTLLDEQGRDLSHADSFYYRQDPVAYFEIPRDGRYTIQIHDSLYRGREDFVYRIRVGEFPYVTSYFPLGARCGSQVNVELTGWNLESTTQDVKLPACDRHRSVEWFALAQDPTQTTRLPLQVDLMADVFDQEPNNTEQEAQEVAIRNNLHGRIDEPGDQDVYFIGRSGRLVAEVHARRLGSPLDSMLLLIDKEGKVIASNDDHEDKSLGLQTHHADSILETVVPSAGAYLHISDTQGNGGRDFAYLLSLRSPEPDYEIRVTPGSIIARAGSITPITVHALRRDNYDADIELALVDPPEGFALSGETVPGNADHVDLTLQIPDQAPEEPVLLKMVARGRRGSGDRVWLNHEAVPSENMMQAFIWHHLVPVENWTVIVNGVPRGKAPFEIASTSSVIELVRGKDVFVPIRLADNANPEQLKVTLDSPKEITAEMVVGRNRQIAIRLTTTENAEPGQRGNLLFRAFQETPVEPTEANLNPPPRRTDFGYLPAVPYRVAGRRR